jgi:hypothetical protein
MSATQTAQPETFDREKYVEKIRLLLAKAEKTDNKDEAETFFAKAQDLMNKWEVEEAELRDSKQAGPIDWNIVSRSYPLSSYSPNQDSLAMQCVARGMGLRAYQKPYVRGCQKAETVVFGTAEDLDRFDMMWASINVQMVRAMKREEDSRWNRNQQRSFRLGFKVGFGQRVGERIAASRAKGTGKALVLAGKAEAIDAAMPDSLKTSNMKVNGQAADAGARAGNRANISGDHRATGGGTRAAVKA